MATVGEIFKGAFKGLTEMVGVDGSKIGKAFAASAMDGVEMGLDAIRKSRADSAKAIVQMAAKNGSFAGTTEDVVKGLTKNADFLEQAEKIATAAAKDGNGITDEVFQKAIKDFSNKKGAYEKALSSRSATDINAFLGKEGDKLSFGTKRAGFYGNEEFGKTRKLAVRGGVVGAAVGVRYLSGGNLTTNARGEHDIAGIPFF